jgi:hypothetical protein
MATAPSPTSSTTPATQSAVPTQVRSAPSSPTHNHQRSGEASPGSPLCCLKSNPSRFGSGANFSRAVDWKEFLMSLGSENSYPNVRSSTGLPGKLPVLNCCFRIFSTSSMRSRVSMECYDPRCPMLLYRFAEEAFAAVTSPVHSTESLPFAPAYPLFDTSRSNDPSPLYRSHHNAMIHLLAESTCSSASRTPVHSAAPSAESSCASKQAFPRRPLICRNKQMTIE